MIKELFLINFKWVLRDRVLQALVGVAFLLLVLVPAVSSLSMRQVQELSITLSLSCISLVLFVLSAFLGASSIWRDIEKRYTISVLTLPYGRASYLFGKFLAISLFLILSAVLFAVVTTAAIWFSSTLYQSQFPVRWSYLFTAIAFDVMKYILLSTIAMLFSSLSTSFFLPIFGTISMLLVGNASQDVFEFITTNALGAKMSLIIRAAVKFLYYIIPNFSTFNLKVSAIYPVPLQMDGLFYTFTYFLVYTGILLLVSVRIFSRREF
jgi:ABC-type transport system involved in multi-copper enzyme maturation permease subunit